MKTREEIEKEVHFLECMRLDNEANLNPTEDDNLNASIDALLWVLGDRENSPSQVYE